MKKINLILSSLALALALAFAPALAQEESVAAPQTAGPSPTWSCRKKSSTNFNLLCGVFCIEEEGGYAATNAGGERVLRWLCPNSDLRKECAAYPCSSVTECRALGLNDFGECHNNGRAECRRQAQAATGARCVRPAGDGS